jgi:hypothetical protein
MIDWKASRRWPALVCLLACGCSVNREIPRGEYAAKPEREHVVVKTRAGGQYQFDRVQVRADSLYGQKQLDVEGSFDTYQTTALALDDITALTVRKLDWFKVGLVAGVAAAVVLAAVLTQPNNDSSDTGSGGGPCGSRGCP